MVRLKRRHLLVQILYPSESRHIALNQAVTQTKHLDNSALLFHSPTPDSVDSRYLTKLIRDQVALLFGDQGAGTLGSSLAVKYFSNATSTFIVRCSRACVRQVWAALTLISELKVPRAPNNSTGRQNTHRDPGSTPRDHLEVVIKVVRVSGTIKKAEEEAIKRARALCGRVKGFEDAVKSGISSFASLQGAIENDGSVGDVDHESLNESYSEKEVFDTTMNDEQALSHSESSSGEEAD